MERSIIVVSTVDAQGEHFFIMQPPDGHDLAKAMSGAPKLASAAETKGWVRERWQQYLQSQPALTEADARRTLATQGFTDTDVDAKIAKARRAREWDPQNNLEFLTQPGYRNAHHQVVVEKTMKFGSTPFQRLYVVRCDRCGHEREVEGSEIHRLKCSECSAQG